jgi:hypothetical protein
MEMRLTQRSPSLNHGASLNPGRNLRSTSISIGMSLSYLILYDIQVHIDGEWIDSAKSLCSFVSRAAPWRSPTR